MSLTHNRHNSAPRPTASRLVGEDSHDTAFLDARRAAKVRARRIYVGGLSLLAVMAGVGGASINAGGGRPLAHNIVHNTREAFSDPNPGVVTGEPSDAQAAHQAQVNEDQNAAVAAAKAGEIADPPK
jgi:hypothetical protein